MDLNTVRKVCQKAQPLLLPTLALQLLGLEIHIRKLGVIMHLHVT